jgi:hypothetical protein
VKQVLLTLIAGMISTNVRKASSRRDDPIFRQSFDVVRFQSTPSTDTTVGRVVFTLSLPLAQGTLLGLFCDGLEQQIQYRTYFYKSSRMIREVLSCAATARPLGSQDTPLTAVVRVVRVIRESFRFQIRRSGRAPTCSTPAWRSTAVCWTTSWGSTPSCPSSSVRTRHHHRPRSLDARHRR